MLTKKHFLQAAQTVRAISNRRKRDARMEAYISDFLNNPRFDQEKFRQLCTGKETEKIAPMPPGVSYQHLIAVDTSEWFPDPMIQFKELWRVTYKGVTYNLNWESDDCRNINYYPKNHVWAGQVCSFTLDYRHVFEQFTGRKPEYNCGSTEVSTPDCSMREFLMNFLFNVKGCEHIEGCTAYQCHMTFTVEQENLAIFEKDLKFIASILRAIKYEFEKDMPKKED